MGDSFRNRAWATAPGSGKRSGIRRDGRAGSSCPAKIAIKGRATARALAQLWRRLVPAVPKNQTAAPIE